MWAKEHMLATAEPPMISPADILIPHCVDTFEDAIALLKIAHTQWTQCK